MGFVLGWVAGRMSKHCDCKCPQGQKEKDANVAQEKHK